MTSTSSPLIKKLRFAGIVIGAVVVAGVVLGALFGGRLIKSQVEGEAFRAMLSKEVSKAIKVEGEFSPLTYLGDWKVETAKYRSKGQPGQAIGKLDADGLQGKFDPWGVFRRVWEVDTIAIDSGVFALREPNDALKREQPQKPKPWYAVFMPTRFHCRWIECPNAEVEFPFLGRTGRLYDVRVGATMIGRNLKYFGSHGRLDFPPLPELRADAVEVYVTRQMVEIGYAYLGVPGDAAAGIKLSGRLGQHEDKSIQAKVKLDDVEASAVMPKQWKGILTGRITANAEYETDKAGKNATSSGTLQLTDGELSGLRALDALAEKQDNPALKAIEFEDAKVVYQLQEGRIDATEFVLTTDKVDLKGTASWELESAAIDLDFEFDRMPLAAWLPEKLSDGIDGHLEGRAKWDWVTTDPNGGEGGGRFALRKGRLSGFEFQKFLARFLKDDRFLDLALDTAKLRWQHQGGVTTISDLEVVSPGEAGLRGGFQIDGDGALSGTVLAGLNEASLKWLPDATTTVFSKQEDGLYWATVELSGTTENPKSDLVDQVVAQLKHHPWAMAELAERGLSWWLGDVLHTAPRE